MRFNYSKDAVTQTPFKLALIPLFKCLANHFAFCFLMLLLMASPVTGTFRFLFIIFFFQSLKRLEAFFPPLQSLGLCYTWFLVQLSGSDERSSCTNHLFTEVTRTGVQTHLNIRECNCSFTLNYRKERKPISFGGPVSFFGQLVRSHVSVCVFLLKVYGSKIPWTLIITH